MTALTTRCHAERSAASLLAAWALCGHGPRRDACGQQQDDDRHGTEHGVADQVDRERAATFRAEGNASHT